MSTWWIDEPILMGSGNPTDRELEQLRSAGFTLVVSLLDETNQQPRYDPERAAKLGLKRENFGVEDFHAPSLAQLSQFVNLVQSEAPEGKTLVHCQGGTGRTGTAAAAYWIAKGVPFGESVARVREARPGAVETEEQLDVLRAFEEQCQATNWKANPTNRIGRRIAIPPSCSTPADAGRLRSSFAEKLVGSCSSFLGVSFCLVIFMQEPFKGGLRFLTPEDIVPAPEDFELDVPVSEELNLPPGARDVDVDHDRVSHASHPSENAPLV